MVIECFFMRKCETGRDDAGGESGPSAGHEGKGGAYPQRTPGEGEAGCVSVCAVGREEGGIFTMRSSTWNLW